MIKEHGYPKEPVVIDVRGQKIIEKALAKAVEDEDLAELSNLKHSGYNILYPLSYASFHQATRQRTLSHSVESIYDAAKRRQFITPPKILYSESASIEYQEQVNEMFDLREELLADGISEQETIGLISHGTIGYDLIDIDGWNMTHYFTKRLCEGAQWEIRGNAKKQLKVIKEASPAGAREEIEKYIGTSCEIDKMCPEKNPCKAEFISE